MGRDRQIKIITIIALVVAITGMSLGFAAFSSTLSISSSASVNPNSSDFKIKIYGYSETTGDNIFNISAYTSETQSYGFNDNTGEVLDAVALINNSTLSITGIDVQMTQPGDERLFLFKVSNEGQYDAYFNLSQLKENTPITCIAESNTTESLVNEACGGINSLVGMITEEGMAAKIKYDNGELTDDEFGEIEAETYFGPGTTGTYKLEKEKSVFLLFFIDYGLYANRADGPFAVTFDDIQLEFTTNQGN